MINIGAEKVTKEFLDNWGLEETVVILYCILLLAGEEVSNQESDQQYEGKDRLPKRIAGVGFAVLAAAVLLELGRRDSHNEDGFEIYGDLVRRAESEGLLYGVEVNSPGSPFKTMLAIVEKPNSWGGGVGAQFGQQEVINTLNTLAWMINQVGYRLVVGGGLTVEEKALISMLVDALSKPPEQDGLPHGEPPQSV